MLLLPSPLRFNYALLSLLALATTLFVVISTENITVNLKTVCSIHQKCKTLSTT